MNLLFFPANSTYTALFCSISQIAKMILPKIKTQLVIMEYSGIKKPDCIKALLKNKPIIVRYPDAIRPWQHVLEPLFGYLLLAQRPYKDGPIFTGAWNFGPNDEDIKPVRWLVELITKMWGNNASWKIDQSINPYEAHYLKLDCSKAKSKIGWYPQWNLNLALEKTVEWFKAYCNHKDMLNITINQIQSYEKCILKKREIVNY